MLITSTFWYISLIPLYTVERSPLPLLFIIFNGTIFTVFGVHSATRPATFVPCPLSSETFVV